MKYTLAHVTHEAVEKIGGIGSVLEGLMTSPVYQQHVARSILVGPCATHLTVDGAARLGEHGQVLYSSVDDIDHLGLASRFKPIEWAFNTAIIYGRRTYRVDGDKRTGQADVLLIDVFRPNIDRLAQFKLRLWETFGIDSRRYEDQWDYEEYVRLAEPAFYALRALLDDDELPCILFSHEFMGMPAALKAILDGEMQFRTIFHAHECSTARHLVEHHPGHDTMFYNVLGQARRQGRYVEDVFGDQSVHLRHALISRACLCDGVIAVGDYTAQEMHFLGRQFDHHQIDLVYNGLPAMKVSLARKKKARRMLADYAQALLGHRPDILMTHVARPVVSKALWRDVQLAGELDRRLAGSGRSAVLFILTSAGGVRRRQDIRSMEKEYGWPMDHRPGYPDLVGPEVDFWEMIRPFNADHQHVKIVLVNQFGWSADRIGRRLPAEMTMADLRFATDVELGMACYEPFGISPLEPLGAGAVCVISNVCGCRGFVEYVTDGRPVPNVLVADYTRLDRALDIEQLLAMSRQQRDAIEQAEAARLADALLERLPANDAQRKALLDTGQQLVGKMGWDQVVEHKLLPMLHRVVNGKAD